MRLALSATCSPSMPSPGSTPLVKHPEDNDLFYLELRYDQLFTASSPTGGTISGLSGTLQKGGNIAQMAWRVRGRERQAWKWLPVSMSIPRPSWIIRPGQPWFQTEAPLL